jgi:membrane protease YdiL (CAAX protease family)
VAAFLVEFFAWLMVAIVCLVLALAVWLWARSRGRGLLPPEHPTRVPWAGLEITVALILTRILLPPLLGFALTHYGFFSWLYGPGFGPSAPATTAEPDEIAVRIYELASDDPAVRDSARIQLMQWGRKSEPALRQKIADVELGGQARQLLHKIDANEAEYNLWLSVWIFPFDLLTVIVVFCVLGTTKPFQLGLSFNRPWENVGVACLCWLAVTPLVFGVNFLADLVFVAQPHPLQQLASEALSPMNGVLIGLSALVLAPIWEELVFRRIIQSWLAQRDWGGHVGMLLALLVAFAPVVGLLNDDVPIERAMLVSKLRPVLFVIFMFLCFLCLHWLLRGSKADRNVIGGIYATALLFGIVHSSWPTPIPLFFLGLGLGFLAYRTQSLIGPIVLHSLFNAVACISLLIPQLGPENSNGRAATSAVARPAPTATSTRVPGVSQLR